VQLLGARQVVAVDPDEEAVDACRARLPGVDVRVGSAEALPFANGEFDAVLAQLVVTLLGDAERGASEMRRVARSGAIVAACVWDFADLWHPLVLPDGSPGRFYTTLDARRRTALQDDFRRRLGCPEGPFRLPARAWYVTGRA